MIENILCIIPARNNSKGIPNKNLQKICGLPLVGYSIRYAIQEGFPLSNIVVSSDGDEILKYSQSWQVNCHKRPDDLSGDNSSTEDCMLDVLKNAFPFKDFDSVMLLQPTSPIRFKGRVQEAINLYASQNYDSLLSVNKMYPFFWQKKKDDNLNRDYIVSTYPPRSRPMRQQIPREDLMYFENGNMYITKVPVLLETKCRIGSNPYLYEISDIESMQIDNPSDLQIFNKVISSSVLRTECKM